MTGRAFTFSEYFIEETFNDLRDSRYTDVKIILSDEPTKPEYLLHKVILAATSSFFRKLFCHEPKKVYEIGAVSKSGFDHVLGHIYGQTLTANADNFDGIVDTALYLGCEGITERLNNMEYLVKNYIATVQIRGTSTIYIPSILSQTSDKKSDSPNCHGL